MSPRSEPQLMVSRRASRLCVSEHTQGRDCCVGGGRGTEWVSNLPPGTQHVLEHRSDRDV